MHSPTMSAQSLSPKNMSEIHVLAKGWKAAIARAKDPNTRHEARIKNDRGNLPLHSAASFRAPLEVTGAFVQWVLLFFSPVVEKDTASAHLF
jgi:hypothetical protein